MRIRELFDPSKNIDRRIEKVITYDTTDDDRIRQEITEYIATDSIEASFERLLDLLDEGMGGGDGNEIGVWVSGFYGSGKSSFTKYLGFALDPERTLDGKPFLEWLQNRFTSKTLRARLATVAKKHPTAVIMLDLASEQLAGATMAEISTVLYSKVMQWAGFSREKKIAYLEFMLERDGRLAEFEARVPELVKGISWRAIHNDPLVTKSIASRLASEFYPQIWPDARSFNDIKIEEAHKEDDRVREMIDLVRRRSGKKNVLFVLDEVGQYVAARDDLILNLDGLAKNIRKIGKGHVWVIATAQQTLTEDDPRAHMNTAKLFKLKDRFPVPVDLEASDIKDICIRRLLGKSKQGEDFLKDLFASKGQALRHATQLVNTRYYKSDLDEKTFCNLYPFLPQHFDILMELLSRLAKTSGGIGLRSAIKIIQDVLVDQSGVRPGEKLLADQDPGALANTVVLYDTMRKDIQRSFRHIVEGVGKVQAAFGLDSIHTQTAKSIAVLQVLEDFPVSRENLAALMHPSVDSPSLLPHVKNAVEDLLKDPAIPLSEIDGSFRFMSEAVTVLEKDRQKIIPKSIDLRNILNGKLREIFTPLPSARLHNSRTVNCGVRVVSTGLNVSLLGEKEEIQMHLQFAPEATHEARRQEAILESQQKANRNAVYLVGFEDPEIENQVIEISRSLSIYNQNRNKTVEKEITDYLNGQLQLSERLGADVENRLTKALARGSFVFRGKPKALSELDSNLREAARKFLESVAEEVFEKYAEAPVQADSGTAERFLKTEKLDKIASKDDPLTLVKKIGKTVGIDITHNALVSMKDYLEKFGQTDGRKILDDFYASPFGWSKDTTRYLTAALLVAGEIKLRVSGQDITVRGDVAIESLKNTINFNKIGVALRASKPLPEALLRAAERLLELTGEMVLPLEEEISRSAMKHFPDFQQDFAPLGEQLKNLKLPGVDIAHSIQESIAEILKGDASDATSRLGCEPCPLHENLLWARKVRKAFDNGLEAIVTKVNFYLAAIPLLPDSGIPGDLLHNTEFLRQELLEIKSHIDFHSKIPEFQTRLAKLDTRIQSAATELIDAERQWLESEKNRLQHLKDWGRLGEEDRIKIATRMEMLAVVASVDLKGIQKIINDHYALDQKIKDLEKTIHELAEEQDEGGDNGGEAQELVVDFSELPIFIENPGQIDELIGELESLKAKLGRFLKLRISWKLQPEKPKQ